MECKLDTLCLCNQFDKVGTQLLRSGKEQGTKHLYENPVDLLMAPTFSDIMTKKGKKEREKEVQRRENIATEQKI